MKVKIKHLVSIILLPNNNIGKKKADCPVVNDLTKCMKIPTRQWENDEGHGHFFFFHRI